MTGPARLLALGALLAGAIAPDGPRPPTTPALTAPQGSVEERAVDSKILGRERRVWVYLPPAYSPSAAAYDLLVVFDGGEYLEQIPLPKILDTLTLRHEAGPFVAILVDNASSAERLADLANHERFADFVATELTEWARRNWNVTLDPLRTIVTGSSAGGLAAAGVAFRHPDVFGNVLSQSGAFWRGNEGSNGPPYEWLTDRIAASRRKDVRFLLEVGSRESQGAMAGTAPSILAANRRLRDVLRRKGYDVTYAEVEGGGHGPEFWSQRLSSAIATLVRMRTSTGHGSLDERK